MITLSWFWTRIGEKHHTAEGEVCEAYIKEINQRVTQNCKWWDLASEKQCYIGIIERRWWLNPVNWETADLIADYVPTIRNKKPPPAVPWGHRWVTRIRQTSWPSGISSQSAERWGSQPSSYFARYRNSWFPERPLQPNRKDWSDRRLRWNWK